MTDLRQIRAAAFFRWFLPLLVLTCGAPVVRGQGEDSASTQPAPSAPGGDGPKTAGMAAVSHAMSLLNAGKTEQAIGELTQIVDSAGTSVDTHFIALALRAKVFKGQGRKDRALLDYSEVIASRRAMVEIRLAAIMGRMELQMDDKDWKSVVHDANIFLEMADQKILKGGKLSRGDVIGMRAMAYYQLNDQTKALADCNEALSDPDLTLKTNICLLRAHVYRKVNRLSAAAEDLQRVIDSPDTSEKMRANTRVELKEVGEVAATQPAAR